MTDPIAIILEFLQRYNLSNTEAALRSELRARQGGTCFSLPSYALRETETVSDVYKEQPKADSEPDLSNAQFASEQRSLVDHLSKPRLENFSFISEPAVQNIPFFDEQIAPNADEGGNRALIMPRIEKNPLLKHKIEDLKISLMGKKITSHNIYTQEIMHKNQSLDDQLHDEACIASTRVQSSGQRSKTEETSCGNRALTMPRVEKNPSLKHKEEDLKIALMEKKITSHNSYTQENMHKTQSLDDQLQDETCIASTQVQSSGQRRKTEETSWEQLKGLPLFESINETHHSNPETPQFDKPMIITETKNSLLNSEKIILSQVSPNSEYGLKKKQAYKTMEDDAALMYPKKESENETMLSWEMDFYNDNTGFIGYEELKEYKAKSNSDFSRLSHLRLTSLNMGEDPNNDGFRLDSMADTGPSTNTASTLTSSFELGCYLDAPTGQDIAGNKWLPVSSQLSSRHSIVEESPELLSGFATLGDGPDDSGVGFSLEYWGSDTYDDEDDPGYIRQPIEDEAWFLANEIDYLSDEDGEKSSKETSGHLQKDTMKPKDLYCFSGEQLCNRSLNDSQAVSSMEKGSKSVVDVEEIKLMKTEPMWPGSVAQSSVQKGVSYEINNQRKGLERLSGTENGSEVRDSLIGGSSEGDVESLRDREPSGYDAVYSVWENSDNEGNESINSVVLSGGYFDEDGAHKSFKSDQNIKTKRGFLQYPNQLDEDSGEVAYGGFSFSSPLTTCNLVGQKAEKEKSLWSTCDNLKGFGDRDIYSNGVSGPDDTVTTWKRKSNDSSPMINLRQEHSSSVHSTLSPQSSGSGVVLDRRKQGGTKEREEVAVITADDVDNEETIALQEQIRRIRAEEDDYEIFNLRIIHRKDRTGFEEEKNFPVVMNSIIAGRYHVTEYLGSAAFSNAIQAHDLQTGMDVCMKIIKNNKDFFDQSLDEIKLLKYVNKHDPADKYHILRLYDYFYYHEHLFIVCELLRANLYEFQKFNREAGGEVYFTMPRLQSIARQCLESIEFLHCLGLVHCDLKPENILIKSYSRCEIKVIDLGSSCFQTDHLCPYVQSRSYRAPEVILGLPYNHKIDIWSLGCILAELCSGHVLFQNDSLATLLARVIGIIGPIVPEMLAKGHDTHKYFTKSDMLYERSPETNQVEYLVPKKTSLRHRLPLADQGFVDFVAYLLQINPENRPTSTEALKHPWLSYPYDPISS